MAKKQQPATPLVPKGAVAIPLKSRKYPGLCVLIDEADADLAARLQWRLWISKDRAVRYARSENEDGRHFYMHRWLLNAPPGVKVDHINGDGLDCRRSNLRLATTSQNAANRRGWGGGYKGVREVKRKDGSRYTAEIRCDGRYMHLGTFDTAEEAAAAYDQKAVEAFGEFALTNFLTNSRVQAA
jgi:hypothetical protein